MAAWWPLGTTHRGGWPTRPPRPRRVGVSDTFVACSGDEEDLLTEVHERRVRVDGAELRLAAASDGGAGGSGQTRSR